MYQSSISMHLLKSSICINYFELYMHKFFKHIEFKQILWSLICIDDLINWLKYIMLKCISGIVHEIISSNSFFFLSHAVCENLSFAQVWCVLYVHSPCNKSITFISTDFANLSTLYQTRLMWAHTAEIFQDSMICKFLYLHPNIYFESL